VPSSSDVKIMNPSAEQFEQPHMIESESKDSTVMLSPLRAGKYSHGGSHHPSSRVLGQPAFKIQLIQEEDTPL